MELAVDAIEKLVLHNGKPVYVDGSKHYVREYDSQMIRFLLTALNREKYGERKVVEINLEDWDGDVDKLSTKSIKGIIEILERLQAIESAQRAIVGPVVDAVAEEITDDDLMDASD